MRIVFAALLVLGTAVSAGDLKDLDAQNGFLNYHFGDRLEEAHNLIAIRTFGSMRMFASNVDRKSFRKANLQGIAYLYYGDRLYAVALAPWTDADSDMLIGIFTEMYGDPLEGSRAPQWWGKRVGLKWIPNLQGHPPWAVFMDRQTVKDIEETGTDPFEILDRVD